MKQVLPKIGNKGGAPAQIVVLFGVGVIVIVAFLAMFGAMENKYEAKQVCADNGFGFKPGLLRDFYCVDENNVVRAEVVFEDVLGYREPALILYSGEAAKVE